jgi:histone H3/H4
MDNLYAKELSKQSIARACAALGIKHIRSECVDALADIVRNHVRTIAIASRENAEQSGRAYAGIQDIIRALEAPVILSFHILQ